MVESQRLHQICQLIESEILDVLNVGQQNVNAVRLRQKVVIELPAEMYDRIFTTGERQVIIRGVKIRRGL